MWRSIDGEHWAPIKRVSTGWDNAIASFNNRLYIGTWNSANSGEVWQRLHELFLPLVRRGE